jgi:CheY-like chemotaxis protein
MTKAKILIADDELSMTNALSAILSGEGYDVAVASDTRSAGLTLIGWLARRMPGEQPHALGVPEARESEARLKAAQARIEQIAFGADGKPAGTTPFDAD